ncbi:MAG TPA: hypothetical protein VM493_04245 [Vicinamibacterales bacterium]|nr:hypothetical protein [Vicinamibacterales bacterium]
MIRDDERLAKLLSGVRRRWFMTMALRTSGTAMAVAALPILAAATVYWLVAPQGTALLAVAVVTILLVLAGITLVVRGIERRPNDRRVARFIEERAEALPGSRPMDDCVVTAVQAASVPADDPRAPFAGLVIGAALRRLENIEAALLIPASSLRQSGLIGGAGAALLVVALVAGYPGLTHSYETARLRLFPGSISVDVHPGNMRIPAGRPVTITAKLHAFGTEFARTLPKLTVKAGGDSRVVDMKAGEDGFEFHFESVDRTFEYTVSAGQVTSPAYTVTALFPPRVQRIDIQYQYPVFSGLRPRIEEDGGDVYAPAGTKVRLAIHVDKPVSSGELMMSAGPSPIGDVGGNVVHADLVLTRNDSYRIRLADADGLASDGDSEYFIRVMDDRPPDVRILRPAGDQAITPLEEFAIEARAEDDFGVASLDLVFAVGGGPERVVPFAKVSGGETDRTGAHLLAAEDLNVKPGDVITYYARARDVGRGKRPSETRSDLFFLEVRPFNEEFVAAQSQANGAGAADQQLGALIEAQKEIINATWKIERRSGGGRSTTDIKAIAQAQAELKARAERALGPPRGRRGGLLPQQIVRPPQPPSGDNPIAAAVAAMTKAIEQLASDRTREAITHEMTALNGLMQAQAEVRRHEIAQQQNSNGGSRGGNRQSQDLSALFDKELQRQQRTNYEQRSRIEERPQQENQDAADRIRDLARRQEAINARQRELERMAEEERKRELARLTRDQEELQRQAEALSREMGQSSQQQQSGANQQQGQSQGQSQQGGKPEAGAQQKPQTGNGGMRGAAEQMRQAAGEMQRNDPQSASRSGERAADQLRRLEQQMRQGSADARQRAAADMQSEAQQIAQEQRRIAGEAERLQKGAGADSAEARRRLSADKDRLADRVESLEREVTRLGREPGKGEEQARARDAAAQLQAGRVSQAMREGARQMKESASPPAAGAEQQIAQTLDRVVEKLGGAASGEARQIAGELERAREARAKLDRLEAQMKAAEGKEGAQQLRQQYEQELRQTREALGRPNDSQRDARGGATPEEQQLSGSAPGTEAFKQDRSGWESLRKDVDRALEEHEVVMSRRLAKVLGEERLSTGGSQGVPEQYRHLVAKYYESLARVRK